MKTQANAEEHSRVATIENELRILREQHAAEMQALREDIKAAKERDAGMAAKELAEVLSRALESPAARIEAADPRTQALRDQEETDRKCDAAAKKMIEPYRLLLTGQTPFWVSAMEPGKPDKDMQNPPAKPMPGMTRLVYADSEALAIAKWERFMGIEEPRIFGLSKYSLGVYPQAIEATPEEAEPVRKRAMEHVERVSSGTQIDVLMIAAGDRAFQARLPKPEIQTLEKMLSD